MNKQPDLPIDLQSLLDASFETASDHLKSIMTEPRRLTAARLAVDLPMPAVLNIATVTAKGEPRISAVDGYFFDGAWHFTTLLQSPKARQLHARPAISASYTPRDGYGVFCHGSAIALEGAARDQLRAIFEREIGVDPETMGDIAYFRIDAHWMVGFAMTDEEMAEIEAAQKAPAAE